jgi:hypothetical protein
LRLVCSRAWRQACEEMPALEVAAL